MAQNYLLARLEFRDTVTGHLDALYRTALRLLGNHHDAEDAVQEALDKAWRKLNQYDPGTQMKAWLFRILTNTCLDMLRARGRGIHRLTDNNAETADIIASTPLPEDAVSDNQLAVKVDRAVNTLPTDQQAVIHLIVVEQLTYAQAAVALDLPVGTIRSRLSRARATINASLIDANASKSDVTSQRLQVVRGTKQ